MCVRCNVCLYNNLILCCSMSVFNIASRCNYVQLELRGNLVRCRHEAIDNKLREITGLSIGSSFYYQDFQDYLRNFPLRVTNF